MKGKRPAIMSGRSKQLTFARTGGWGGKRRGAGRKNLSGTVNHMARPEVQAKWPLQITMRLAPEVLSLRRQSLLKAFADSAHGAKSFGLKVNEFSILGNHFHLIAEASSNENLSRGMQSLLIRLAKSVTRLARELNRPLTTAVFAGRYHLRVLKTPTEMKNALAYVLLNEAKHGGRHPSLSVFSSSFRFKGWGHFKIKFSTKEIQKIEDFWHELGRLEQSLSTAESWLQRVGWQKSFRTNL